MNIVWRGSGLALLVLLCVTPVAARHGAVLLDARRATPGVRLELVELPSSGPRAATARYQLHAEGLPRGVTLGVWAKDFGHGFQEVLSGVRVDAAGRLVSPDGAGRLQPLDGTAFGPGPYPRGAVWEVTLASADRAVTAFAKVIPRPIAARQGSCAVSLELVSLHGERFVASGTGFTSDEDVIAELRYAGQVIRKTQRASTEGQLPPNVILHGGMSTDPAARYVVKGRSCEVTLEYEWGEAALSRR